MIIELENDNEIFFAIEDLNDYEKNPFLIAYLIEHEMGAKVVDSHLDAISLIRVFKKNDIEFKLVAILDFDEFAYILELTKYEASKIDSLRKIANELFSHIKDKSKDYRSEEARELLKAPWKKFL